MDTIAPPRNFTMTAGDRLRAYTGGVPAWARRRRAIEDLEARLLALLAAPPDQRTAGDLAGGLTRLNDLIDRHNRYYPIEANLPLDPRTGAVLDRGAPWRPLPLVTMDDLRARAGGQAAQSAR